MKNINLMIVVVAMCAGTSFGATAALYTASNGPLQNPDGNGNTVDVWSFFNSNGSWGGDGFFDKNGSFGDAGLATPWQIYNFGTSGDGGAGTYVQADHTFVGGALKIGQSVSLTLANQSLHNDGSIGFELLDAGTTSGLQIIRFGWNGADSNYFIDAPGGSGFTLSSSPVQSDDVYTVTITITGAGTFNLTTSGMAGGDTNYNGTYDTSDGGALTARVYAYQSGGESDVTFNSLTITPEPTSAMLSLACLGGLTLLRRR